MAEGIDVHGSKGRVDWARVKSSGREFAFVKATEGATFIDAEIRTNLYEARRAGLLVAPYHYARPDIRPTYFGGVTEAEFFCAQILEKGWKKLTDGLPVLDLEEGYQNVEAFTFGFMDTAEALLGVTPILYTYPHFAQKNLSDKRLTRYPLWIAAYGDNDDQRESAPPSIKPWGTNWIIHQYSSNGSVPGVHGRCDLNFAPSIDVFRAKPKDVIVKDWPRPVPAWFWEWAKWRLQGKSTARPYDAPRVIPPWAWRRLRALIQMRNK